MQPLARTVVLSTAARKAVDSSYQQWDDAERAWAAIEWVLARDPQVGVSLTESGNLRAFVYDGARSIKQPDVQVIYEIQPNEIIVHIAMFADAKAARAGIA
jgi:hypothetical protein